MDSAPPPPHLVRDRILPYPRGHARRMTVLGFLLAAAAFILGWWALRTSDPSLLLVQRGYTVLFFVAALALVPLHEGLHVAAALLGGMPLRDIQLGFRRGFIYVRFHRSMPVRTLRVVLLAPLVLLGIPLLVFCLRSGDRQWLVLFAAHVGSTVADLYTYWRLRGLDGRCHALHEGRVQGLTIFRPGGDGAPAPAAAPVPVLAGQALVGLSTVALFVLGPFLVPPHELLSDMTLRRPRDVAIAATDGGESVVFDYHAASADAVHCTARAWRAGRLVARGRATLPVDDGSGRLVLHWRVDPAGPPSATTPEAGPGTLAVWISAGDATAHLLRCEQSERSVTRMVTTTDDDRIHIGQPLVLARRYVSGQATADGAILGASRAELPPGLEVEVHATFLARP